ncbi:MAG: molecular chaperone [Deltaproteobacteria bacterium]|nr:molecular chaperone [Deltaproteobacteria bacterium]
MAFFRPWRIVVQPAAWVVFAVGFAGAARAGTLSVEPIKIALTPDTPNSFLTVSNDSDAPMRVQVTMFEWGHDADGKMLLAPTKDIIYFPPLFALKVGEKRRVRLGSATTFGEKEKTYRLFVEELPAVAKKEEKTIGVKVLMRLGIPIFLPPAKPNSSVQVGAAALRGGKLAFEVRNAGNVHVVLGDVEVEAFDAKGTKLVAHKWNGWYLLAAMVRRFENEVPADVCPLVTSVKIRAETGPGKFIESAVTVSGGCAP